MKKLPIFLLGLIAVIAIHSCKLDPQEDTWEYYKEWRDANNAWLEEQQSKTDEDGNPYYKKVIPEFDQSAYVLMHYFNDRKKTEGNLSPLYSSTVDVKYIGRLYDDEPFDSSYLQTTYGDSIYRVAGLSNVVEGWAIALMDMRVGDSCEVIIPYQSAYGNQIREAIAPYSHLKFNLKLVDIPGYEKPAN